MPSVTYRFTEADLVDARRHAYNSMPVVRVVRLAPPVLALACVAWGGWLAVQGAWDGVFELSAWLLLALVLIGWTFIGDRWILPASVRKSLARDKGFQDDVTVAWDAEGYVLDSSHGQSRWPWGDLARWQESPGGLLLYQSARLYNYLPKRCLAAEQVDDIRDRLTAHAVPGKPRKARRAS